MTILALIGSTCTGKTTCGEAVSGGLSLPFRSCGDTIRELARERRVSIDELTATDHAMVDDQSREWCEQEGDIVIEGRFLDQVLYGHRRPIYIIRLVADDQVRAERLTKRSKVPQTIETVQKFDRDDELFRLAAYEATPKLVVNEELDNSLMTVSESVGKILLWWDQLLAQRD